METSDDKNNTPNNEKQKNEVKDSTKQVSSSEPQQDKSKGNIQDDKPKRKNGNETKSKQGTEQLAALTKETPIKSKNEKKVTGNNSSNKKGKKETVVTGNQILSKQKDSDA